MADIWDLANMNLSKIATIAGDAINKSGISSQQTSLFNNAQSEYPILKKYPVQYKYNPRENATGGLESWSPTEEGTPEAPRPKEFPMGQFGVEVYSDKTKPLDIIGDVTSHYLRNVDPKVKGYYDQFAKSLTPFQQNLLKEQYEWNQKNQGEKRPFDQWKETSGLPAMFRGYAFQQWPQEFNKKVYTSGQKGMFDEMMDYLKTGEAK
jgi:hypothetical protein